MNDKPVVLTAEMAAKLPTPRSIEACAALDAIAYGRTVVVPADELSRLRGEVERLTNYAEMIRSHSVELAAERDRLRARVAELEAGEPQGWLCTREGRTPVFVRDARQAEDWRKLEYDVRPLYLGPQRMTPDGEAT